MLINLHCNKSLFFNWNREKRHRSSSSLAGVLESVRSEKRLDVRASIPEVDDQFAIAEARCDDLQEKINLVKALKRKKKLKKRSMTTITEPVSNMGNVPMITIRTRPKKKVSQEAEKYRRLQATTEVSNPARGYVDPDFMEQRRMLNRVHGYSQMNQQQYRLPKMKQHRDLENVTQPKLILHRDRADGDSEQESVSPELVCGDDKSYDNKMLNRQHTYYAQSKENNDKKYYDSRPQSKQLNDIRNRNSAKAFGPQTGVKTNEKEKRQVVELFKKTCLNNISHERTNLNINIAGEFNKQKTGAAPNKQQMTDSMENIIPKVKKPKASRNTKYRIRHYELPTVSSKMKQVALHCGSNNMNHVTMPFIVSKSSAPSHNVGVNLQQILNGHKLQQPLSKIPLTIAHQMGLRHVPSDGTKSATMHPTLNSDSMNVIKLGEKLVHLPSFKAMSYSRLLSLYRSGNSVVSRFLCTVGRPHYFYTSMYDLSTNLEDFDAATSKGQGGSQAAKQSLAEYASLYREYEQVEKLLNENYDPELEKHKKNLANKLTERENYIRKLVRDTGAELEAAALETPISVTGDSYRHSTFKLQSGT